MFSRLVSLELFSSNFQFSILSFPSILNIKWLNQHQIEMGTSLTGADKRLKFHSLKTRSEFLVFGNKIEAIKARN